MKNRSNYLNEVKYSKKLKTIASYIGLAVLWLVTANVVGMETLLYTLAVLMLGVTWATVKFIPNDRDASLGTFKITFLGYPLWLLMMHLLTTALTIDGGQLNVMGFLQGTYSFTTFMVPVGYIVWQAKKFSFLLGIGKSKKEAIDYYKDHGNDGLM